MRLLIVDDDELLAELTAQLLQWVDQPTRQIEQITLASDLDTALEHLPQHHAVLCDGEFPISQDSRYITDEWDVVHREASRRGIHFILYSGSPQTIESARMVGIPAIAKPATIEEVYARLVERRPEVLPIAVPNQQVN